MGSVRLTDAEKKKGVLKNEKTCIVSQLGNDYFILWRIGGICGKVVSVKENNLVIETGTDRTRMLITRWAVQQNNSAMERVAAEREAAKAAAEKAKAEKKAAKSKKNED